MEKTTVDFKEKMLYKIWYSTIPWGDAFYISFEKWKDFVAKWSFNKNYHCKINKCPEKCNKPCLIDGAIQCPNLIVTKESENDMTKTNNNKQQIQKIEDKIEELKQEVEKLKNNDEKNVRWRAEKDEEYYYCGCTAVGVPSIYQLTDHQKGFSNFNYSIGNYFKTEEEAEKHYNHLIITQKLKDIALRLNNGEEIDWGNYDQEKWYIYVNHLNYLNLVMPYHLLQHHIQ